MSIRQDIMKTEGLAEKIGNEIEVWFEKHFGSISSSQAMQQAKAELHEALGTASASTPS